MRTTLAAALVIIFASVLAMPNSALGEPVTLNYAVTVNELFRYTPISTTPIDPVSFSMTVTLDDQVLRTFTDAVGNRFTFFSAPSFSGVPPTTFRTRLGTPAVLTAGHTRCRSWQRAARIGPSPPARCSYRSWRG